MNSLTTWVCELGSTNGLSNGTIAKAKEISGSKDDRSLINAFGTAVVVGVS